MNDAGPVVPRIRHLGRRDYEPVWRDMQRFVADRADDAVDEIWLVEHPPVFTLGQNGAPEHVLAAGDIPVIHVDRGGQVTYHGPGQLVVYPLVNLARLGLSVRGLVCALEKTIVDLCAQNGITAAARRDAPGVYVDGAKLASIGLRVKKNWCYHGMALNVAMDLGPFGLINPCGYAGLAMTQLRDLGVDESLTTVAGRLLPLLLRRLGYTTHCNTAANAANETS